MRPQPISTALAAQAVLDALAAHEDEQKVGAAQLLLQMAAVAVVLMACFALNRLAA